MIQADHFAFVAYQFRQTGRIPSRPTAIIDNNHPSPDIKGLYTLITHHSRNRLVKS